MSGSPVPSTAHDGLVDAAQLVDACTTDEEVDLDAVNAKPRGRGAVLTADNG